MALKIFSITIVKVCCVSCDGAVCRQTGTTPSERRRWRDKMTPKTGGKKRRRVNSRPSAKKASNYIMAIIRQAENSKNRKRKENQPAQHYKATQSQSDQLVSVVVVVRLCSKKANFSWPGSAVD